MQRTQAIGWILGGICLMGAGMCLWLWLGGIAHGQAKSENYSPAPLPSGSSRLSPTIEVDRRGEMVAPLSFSSPLTTTTTTTQIPVPPSLTPPPSLPQSTLSPTHPLAPTPTTTFLAIPSQSLESLGAVSTAELPVIEFGRSEGSYLFANQLKIHLTNFFDPTKRWFNFELKLITTETNLGFDDPAFVILLGDKPLFAMSAADWQASSSPNWLSFSAFLPIEWQSEVLTLLGGDNGDLTRPTQVQVKLIGFTAEPLYPSSLPSHLTFIPKPHQDSYLLELSPTTPIPLPYFSSSLLNEIPRFFQHAELFWLSANLLAESATPILYPDQSLPSSLQLRLWPLAATIELQLAQ